MQWRCFGVRLYILTDASWRPASAKVLGVWRASSTGSMVDSGSGLCMKLCCTMPHALCHYTFSFCGSLPSQNPIPTNSRSWQVDCCLLEVSTSRDSFTDSAAAHTCSAVHVVFHVEAFQELCCAAISCRRFFWCWLLVHPQCASSSSAALQAVMHVDAASCVGQS